MTTHLRNTCLTVVVASFLSAFLYSIWSLVALAPIAYETVVISAAMIAVGIGLGEVLRPRDPESRMWLLPNVGSFVLSVPLALPYPFDPGMPLCMVTTAVLCARFYKAMSGHLATQEA